MSSNSIKTDLKQLRNSLSAALTQVNQISSRIQTYKDNFMDVAGLNKAVTSGSITSAAMTSAGSSWWAPNKNDGTTLTPINPWAVKINPPTIPATNLVGPIVKLAGLPSADDLKTAINVVDTALTQLGEK